MLNYLIVNAGDSSASQVQTTLETIGLELALGTHAEPQLSSALADVDARFTGELHKIIQSKCDGMVAAEQDTFTYDQLVQYTAQPFYVQTTHIGPLAPHGCNSRRSDYVVHWSIMQVVVVPDVVGMSVMEAKHMLGGVSLGGQVTSGPTGPSSEVREQSVSPGSFAAVGTIIGLTTIEAR